MNEEPTGRILVEGGPVHLHLRRALAIVFGLMVGFAAGLTVGFIRLEHVGTRNCSNIAGLARIERRFIDRQEEQTQKILASGVTFGIPKDKLPGLIQESEQSQARFLGELDGLTSEAC